MTPFVEFCLQHPNLIRLTPSKIIFVCGEEHSIDLCKTCPHSARPSSKCHYFTRDEIIHLKSNYPELLL